MSEIAMLRQLSLSTREGATVLVANFATPTDARVSKANILFNQLLDFLEVHDPIRFPGFTTVG
jgi:hypothetical protein